MRSIRWCQLHHHDVPESRCADLVVLGDLEEIKAFLTRYPNVINKSDEYGQTPQHWIMTEERPAVPDFMITSGAEIHA
jgi:hypothetical protein